MEEKRKRRTICPGLRIWRAMLASIEVEAPRLTTVPQGFKYVCTSGESGRGDAIPIALSRWGAGPGSPALFVQ